MKKALVLICLLLPCLLFSIPIVTSNHNPTLLVYAEEPNQNQTVPVVERELTIDRPYYRTVKIMVSYPYTNSHDITDITTIGASRYSHDSQPDNLVFLTDDIDVYTFTLHVSYANASQRSIMITTWEGDRAPQGETWTENANDFIIHFKLTVMQQPTYPSAEEVANASFVQFENMYVQQLEEQRATNARIEASEFRNSVVSLITVAVAFAAFFWTGFTYSRRKKEENP